MLDEIPGVYLIFHDYFFKSSVGDRRWVAACKQLNKTSRLGVVQQEAFGLLGLKNQYFAWLAEAKMEYPSLVCDYDPESKRNGKKCLSQVLLQGWELNLQGQAGVFQDLIVTETHEKFRELFNDAEAAREEARMLSAHSNEYRKCKLAILRIQDLESGGDGEILVGQEGGGSNGVAGEVRIPLSAADKKKKRKMIIRGLRYYTDSGKEGSGVKFRGWSPKSLKDYAGFCKKMKENGKRQEVVRFREIYREIYQRRETMERGREEKEREVQNDIISEDVEDTVLCRNMMSDDEEDEYLMDSVNGGDSGTSTTTASSSQLTAPSMMDLVAI